MFILRIVFKNALRHKLRFLLTVLGITIAVIAFCLMRTVVTVWYSGVEAAAADRLITRQAVSFIYPLPFAYRDQISKVDGVQEVSYANWFGGTYIEKKNFFARMAVDPETFFDVYPEFVIPPDQQSADGGAMIFRIEKAAGRRRIIAAGGKIMAAQIIVHKIWVI